jgi:hypothetical protein
VAQVNQSGRQIIRFVFTLIALFAYWLGVGRLGVWLMDQAPGDHSKVILEIVWYFLIGLTSCCLVWRFRPLNAEAGHGFPVLPPSEQKKTR